MTVVTIPFKRIHNTTMTINNPDINTENTSSKLNDRRRTIILEMRNNPNITTKELSVILSISENAVTNNISYLKKNGYIERVGSIRSGYWKVIE